MNYHFNKMKAGESQFILGQGFNGSAYTCAMRAQKRHNMKLSGTLEHGGIRITCVEPSADRVKTKYELDVEVIKAMIDWGIFPDVMLNSEAVKLCRKAIPEIPEGKSGQTLVGLMLSDTGMYNRVRVYKKGKTVRMHVRNGVTL